MKKYFLLFLVLVTATSVYLSFPLNSKEHFVSIEGKTFKLNGKDFYPVALNYLAGLRMDGDTLFASPATSYDIDSLHAIFTENSALAALRTDMKMIKHLGFNTVRIVGIGEEVLDNDTARSTALSVYARLKNGRDTSYYLSTQEAYIKYFDALEGLFREVNVAGLKVIFLVRLRANVSTAEQHFISLLDRFKNDSTILAYDLFNEPLYFDHKPRSKTEVASIVKGWKKLMTMYAPNQLCTIGLEGIREIFEWDPNILDVDFLSLHPYDFEPDQVMNETYWYGHYIKKPWIIGETATAADNDSVTYDEQKAFALETLKQVRACGAMGYSWWQYKDVEWHSYRANFMGVVTRNGEAKSVAEAFQKYSPAKNKDSCVCLSNYYNYSQGNKCRIVGRLTDEQGKPIRGGIVLAWNQLWNHSYHTVTKEDGSFELLGTFPFYHWIATATMYSVVRGELLPDSAKIYSDPVPTLKIGTLKVDKLSL